MSFKELIQLNELRFSDIEKNPTFSTIMQNEKFLRWFKGSKVLDNRGKPLVCFHGTTKEFNTFNGLSHFGSMDASNKRMSLSVGALENARNIPVFLSIRKPARIVDAHSNHSSVVEFVFPMWYTGAIDYNTVRDFFLKLVKFHGYTINLDGLNKWLHKITEQIGVYVSYAHNNKGKKTPTWVSQDAFTRDHDIGIIINERLDIMQQIDLTDMRGRSKNRNFFVNWVRSVGYDGFVYKNHIEDTGRRSWIITSPGQVLPVLSAYRFAKKEIDNGPQTE